MNLVERVLDKIKSRRENLLKGEVNCIPSPFKRFSADFLGVEQGRFYLISGAQKSAKTQITNYIFVYSTIWYAYHNPDKVVPKIFYYPLEETPEAVMLRFMSFLLFRLSNGTIRISPSELNSTVKPLNEDIIKLLESDEYKKIIDFFNSCVEFRTSTNPTGAWKDLNNYANTHGTIVYKDIEFVDNTTGEIVHKKQFDHYVPDNPKEYVIILMDHISLTSVEKGLNLRESINKWSEYMVIFRNRFNYIPVMIQQQSTETQNNEAFKLNKIRPSAAGLGDSKYSARDCDIMLGITNPFSFELDSYQGYNIQKLRDSARFLEVVVNRHGPSNGLIGLYFDGAVNYFNELPPPNDTEGLEKIYRYISSTRRAEVSMLAVSTFKVKKWKRYWNKVIRTLSL